MDIDTDIVTDIDSHDPTSHDVTARHLIQDVLRCQQELAVVRGFTGAHHPDRRAAEVQLAEVLEALARHLVPAGPAAAAAHVFSRPRVGRHSLDDREYLHVG